MRKAFAFVVIIICLSIYQAKCDNVIIKGDTLKTIFFTPFSTYPDIVKLRERLIGYRTDCTEDNCSFLSTWEIRNNKLMLTKIENCQCNEKKQTANLTDLFGNKVTQGVMEADWFTGEIWVTKDRPNSWGGMFAQSWPRETRIIVKKGNVISVKEFVYPKPVETIYYKNIDSLNKFVYAHLNWEKVHNLPKINTTLFFNFNQDANGYPINIFQNSSSRRRFTLDSVTLAELIRVIGLLQWPLYYHEGKPVQNYKELFFVFGEEARNKYIGGNN